MNLTQEIDGWKPAFKARAIAVVRHLAGVGGAPSLTPDEQAFAARHANTLASIVKWAREDAAISGSGVAAHVHAFTNAFEAERIPAIGKDVDVMAAMSHNLSIAHWHAMWMHEQDFLLVEMASRFGPGRARVPVPLPVQVQTRERAMTQSRFAAETPVVEAVKKFEAAGPGRLVRRPDAGRGGKSGQAAPPIARG